MRSGTIVVPSPTICGGTSGFSFLPFKNSWTGLSAANACTGATSIRATISSGSNRFTYFIVHLSRVYRYRPFGQNARRFRSIRQNSPRRNEKLHHFANIRHTIRRRTTGKSCDEIAKKRSFPTKSLKIR